ncbi:MAG: O-antigen ligase family protein [Acidobacteriota bacterium]
MSDRFLAWMPALLLALFAGYAGTFVGGATAAGAILGHLAIGLAVFGFAGRVGAPFDPLALGKSRRYLPVALAISALASLFASPVPRAGRAGIVVAVLLALLMPVVAHAFAAERERSTVAVAVVVALVSAYALVAWSAGVSARPSLPLGHHGLLAGWLTIVLPLALLPAVSKPAARWHLGIGIGAGLLGVLALVVSRSAAGLAAGLVEAGIAALWVRDRRLRRILGLAVLLFAVALAPRGFSILSGSDASAAARQVYLKAGLSGWAERPLLGWGPGATPWTIAPFLVPIPGANPPGEAVGELHALPLTVGYELGGTGLILALGLAFTFGRVRLREERAAPDPLRRAGLLGLLGGAVVAFASGAWSVTALAVAAVLAGGAAIAPGLAETVPPSRRAVGLLRAAALAALVLIFPLDLAHQRYDRAIGTDRARSIAALDAAVAEDPSFGLYRARRAAYRARDPEVDAEDALRAAQAAGDVAPLWLLAGELGIDAHRPWSGAALDRACRAAPFDGLAPWLRLRAEPAPADAASVAARALLAEPLLLQAIDEPGRGELRRAAVARIERLSGVEPGWRRALVLAAAREPAAEREVSFLTFGAETPDASFSLHWFRRLPWGAYLGGVGIRSGAEEGSEIPAATRLPTTSAELFSAADCRLGDLRPPVEINRH